MKTKLTHFSRTNKSKTKRNFHISSNLVSLLKKPMSGIQQD